MFYSAKYLVSSEISPTSWTSNITLPRKATTCLSPLNLQYLFIHPSIHPLIHSMHCAVDWEYKCEKKVWSCLGACRAFGGGWGGRRSKQTIMLQLDWWPSGIFEEETLKLTCGPEERGEISWAEETANAKIQTLKTSWHLPESTVVYYW